MDLLDSVKQAGIVGAGGAGFPTHVKLAAQAEYILLNGAECEPLLRVDQQIMDVHADEIIQGFAAAGRQVGAKKALLCIKYKHKKVIARLQARIDALSMGDYVEIRELPDVYPAGDEQIMVYEVLGRTVPEGGIPLNVGCVVTNSETAMNIHRAAKGEAVTETWLTLAGDIPNRMTLKVPVGTPVREVLALTGVDNLDDYRVIDGGPMMGPVMDNIDGHVTKVSKGYILLKKDHSLIRKKTVTPEQAKRLNKATCEQCRMCTDLCPRFLIGHGMEPHKMMRVLNYGMDVEEAGITAQLCCSCNLCELFSCPAGLHPRMANEWLKGKLAEKNIRYTSTKESYSGRANRDYRQVPSKRLIARLGLTRFDQDAPITDQTLEPAEVRIATRQHVGAPCVPAVSAGDRVEKGQIIGNIPEGSLGAPIHASISGRVTGVENDYIAIRKD
ncbi:MAG: 4Fe-4S dicluster domain-containing protein [Desulfobacter sp.]|nr:MAG: 4Fe-4S dicluster domain-containing protein [Desulfobacter sp.]